MIVVLSRVCKSEESKYLPGGKAAEFKPDNTDERNFLMEIVPLALPQRR